MSIIELTKTIKATIATLPPAAELKKDERIALFEACEKLKNAIQTPFEATQKILFAVSLGDAQTILILANLLALATSSRCGTDSYRCRII